MTVFTPYPNSIITLSHVSLPTSCLLLVFLFLITHSVQLVLPIRVAVHWSTGNQPLRTLSERNDSPSSRNYQLPEMPYQRVSPSIQKQNKRKQKLVCLILCRSYAGNHCRHLSMRGTAMSHPKDNLSQIKTSLPIFMFLHVSCFFFFFWSVCLFLLPLLL